MFLPSLGFSFVDRMTRIVMEGFGGNFRRKEFRTIVFTSEDECVWEHVTVQQKAGGLIK